MKVKIVNQSGHALPEYSTPNSAGMDLRAKLDKPVILKPMERSLIPTGLFMELPEGFEAQIRPRSGLALKKGISIVNSPGTIDADYRGEVKIPLINHGSDPFVIRRGARIAQMVIHQVHQAQFQIVDELDATSRNQGGFGSTGT